MTAILGISAFYHDSAAALLIDGQIVAAAQEERFSRVKHDWSFPRRSIAYCLQQAGMSGDDLDYVAFYELPWLKLERYLETQLAFAPRGFRAFAGTMGSWFTERLRLTRTVHEVLGRDSPVPIVFTEHHRAHAASAFFASPFIEAAVMTWDGVGEWATATLGEGHERRLSLFRELRFPHSLGLLYAAFTAFCGFRVNDGEYKLMGLAPYGQPLFVETILDELVDLKPDGSFRLNMSYFDFCHRHSMTSTRFAELFAGPPRRADAPITAREMNLACSIQRVTEEIVMRAAAELHRQTGHRHICLAGGVAHNCVANGRLVRDGPFDQVWIQPAAGDAGGALGAAWHCWHELLDQPRMTDPHDRQQGSFLGPSFSDEEIESYLAARGAAYARMDDDDDLCDRVAELLAQGRIVGWVQGRMEFGPRALGHRSILADPRQLSMRDRINHDVKGRESFRPFAPAVLLDRADEFFELAPADGSPYMLLAVPIRESHRRQAADLQSASGLSRQHVVRSTLPAVTHVDDSARLQTVDRQWNERFYRLLQQFSLRTGVPVLLNTSFNVRDEPIVCSLDDVYDTFRRVDIDVLVLERFVLEKPASRRCDAARLDMRATSRTRIGGHEPTSLAITIDWTPVTGRLRLFGGALAAMSLLAVWWMWTRNSAPLFLAAPAILGLSGLLGLGFPGVVLPVYRALNLILFPLRLVCFYVLLSGVYFLLITPIGLLQRWIGRDVLGLARSTASESHRTPMEATTYWSEIDGESATMQQRRRATKALRGHGVHVTREFLWFLWYRRNWWLMPIVLVLLLLALLAVLTSSGLSPFMYPL